MFEKFWRILQFAETKTKGRVENYKKEKFNFEGDIEN